MYEMAVTPLAGVWIEIINSSHTPSQSDVTPLAGVWIEIVHTYCNKNLIYVTPLAGVWIEICQWDRNNRNLWCHSPCGSVD